MPPRFLLVYGFVLRPKRRSLESIPDPFEALGFCCCGSEALGFCCAGFEAFDFCRISPEALGFGGASVVSATPSACFTTRSATKGGSVPVLTRASSSRTMRSRHASAKSPLL